MLKKLLKLTLIVPLLFMTMTASAAGCIGNILAGTLDTDTGGLIYLSSAEWDAAFSGNPSPFTFESYYDELNPTAPFSGFAWSETFGWLVFTGSTAHFEAPHTLATATAAGNPGLIGQPSGMWDTNLWGGWDGTMDLSGITLSGTTLSGSATSFALTGGAIDDTNDWFVGAGDIDFSGAFLTSGIGTGCAAELNLFANGTPAYSQTGSCPITNVSMTWTSTDVSNCEATAGPWSGSRAVEELVGENVSGFNIPGGSTAIFTLSCTDINDGSNISASASVSCNETVVNPPTGGTGTVPDFIET